MRIKFNIMSASLPTSIGPKASIIQHSRTAALGGGVGMRPFLSTHMLGDAKMHPGDE